MRSMGDIARATLAAMTILVFVAAPVLGYQGQVPAQITLEGACNANQVSAIVTDAQGERVSNVVVEFSFVSKANAADAIAPPEATTDSQGRATIALTLANVPGTRVIQAELAGVGEVTATITLQCRAGLPPTTALPDDAATTSLPLIGLAIALAAGALLGAAFVARRFVRA